MEFTEVFSSQKLPCAPGWFSWVDATIRASLPYPIVYPYLKHQVWLEQSLSTLIKTYSQ